MALSGNGGRHGGGHCRMQPVAPSPGKGSWARLEELHRNVDRVAGEHHTVGTAVQLGVVHMRGLCSHVSSQA